MKTVTERFLAYVGYETTSCEANECCPYTPNQMALARALVAEGHVATMQEAFERYLGEGKPAYVPGERMSMAEALPLLRGEGFVPVLAHPALLNKDDMTLRQLLEAWADRGLMGV